MNEGLVILILLLIHVVIVLGNAKYEKIELALKKCEEVLDKIWKEWSIDEYPTFLVSATMPPHSYELLKHHFKRLILKTLNNGTNDTTDNNKFVISF